jgi:hypothetical protein
MLNGARRVEMKTKRAGKVTDYCPVVSTTRNRALPSDHAFVSFTDAFERKDFIHRADAAEHAEGESILRIHRRAGGRLTKGEIKYDKQPPKTTH